MLPARAIGLGSVGRGGGRCSRHRGSERHSWRLARCRVGDSRGWCRRWCLHRGSRLRWYSGPRGTSHLRPGPYPIWGLCREAAESATLPRNQACWYDRLIALTQHAGPPWWKSPRTATNKPEQKVVTLNVIYYLHSAKMLLGGNLPGHGLAPCRRLVTAMMLSTDNPHLRRLTHSTTQVMSGPEATPHQCPLQNSPEVTSSASPACFTSTQQLVCLLYYYACNDAHYTRTNTNFKKVRGEGQSANQPIFQL
jgi:hypothetical protein